MKFINRVSILIVYTLAMSLNGMKREHVSQGGTGVYKAVKTEDAQYKGKLLYTAVKKADVQAVRQLLDEGADVNYEANEYGSTPLNILSFQSDRYPQRAQILDMLLNAGADITDYEDLNDLPKEYFSIIAKYNIDANKTFPLASVLDYHLADLRQALYFIALGSRTSKEDIRHNLGYALSKPKQYEQDLREQFTLWQICNSTLVPFMDQVFNAVKKRNLEEVKMLYAQQPIAVVTDLIKQGARAVGKFLPDTWRAQNPVGNWVATIKESETGDTPLHYAIRNGDGAMVLYLLSIGANPLWQNVKGETPFMWAATNPAMLLLLMRAI